MATPSKYHWFPVSNDELRITLPPAQNVVSPDAEIVGISGFAFTVTTIPALASLSHIVPYCNNVTE